MKGIDWEDVITSKTSLVLKNIEGFMKDSSYRDILENSASYNTRLRIERKLRMPFLDAQTGVAQNHSNLFMSSRQRMPGAHEGQVYTYPAKRWRKKRRQYLMNSIQIKRKDIDIEPGDLHINTTVDVAVAISMNEDSKDSTGGNSAKDEPITKVPDAWYYEELEMQEMEGFDEPDPDSDYDYEDSYTKKRKRRSGKPSRSSSDTPVKRGIKNLGRGRRKGITYVPDYSDTDKPYYCDICGARYKTRPGLTYHYSHSHKDKSRSTPNQDDDTSLEELPSSPSTSKDKQLSVTNSQPPTDSNNVTINNSTPKAVGGGGATWPKSDDTSYLTLLNNSAASASSNHTTTKKSTRSTNQDYGSFLIDEESSSANSESDKKDVTPKNSKNDKSKPKNLTYCDFCLGLGETNKKSGIQEELVTCADCGRAGHPSCLQFTPTMAASVRTYNWQCIECKCCSFCGTSDNDDQLLFCDSCDRGYHIYCLSPPLSAPPEGSWSCKLCAKDYEDEE